MLRDACRISDGFISPFVPCLQERRQLDSDLGRPARPPARRCNSLFWRSMSELLLHRDADHPAVSERTQFLGRPFFRTHECFILAWFGVIENL